MDLSKFLGKVVGIYLLIISVVILVDMPHFIKYVGSLINDGPLMFVTGFFTLILGVLMVVSHNVWQLNWKVIITIIAWLTLIKGLSIILYPQLLDRATLFFIQNAQAAYSAAIADLILGFILCFFAFKR